MRALNSNPNVDNGDLVNYPGGRIKDNTGTGNGTGVNERVYGDLHQTIAKLMRLYAITPNGLPENETNGFQIVEAFKALASKNDYIYPLSSAGGILQVDIKLSLMQTGEYIVCLASVNKTTETQIKGIGASLFAITYSGSFLANEYVRIIKTISGVSIVRLSDATSLNAMVSDFLYLKKASQVQEDAGALDTVATTPLTNLVAFTKRVIGVDSDDFLSTPSRNGLMSMEDKDKLDNFESNVRNIGYFSGWNVEVNTVGTSFTVSGDIVSAIVTVKSDNTNVVRVTVANTMTNLDYYVRHFVEGLSADIRIDNSIGDLVFKPINATTFDVTIQEFDSQTQNLRIHLEVVKI
jgi:hypothetical protein